MKRLAALILVAFALPGDVPDEGEAPPSETRTALMLYDSEAGAVDQVGDGCIVCVINDVARVIRESDGTGAARFDAHLAVEITPYYERSVASIYLVKLRIGASDLHISARLDPEIQRALRIEALQVMAKLKDYTKVLDDTETRRLLGQGRLSYPLVQPFDHLRLLSKPEVPLDIHARDPGAGPPRLRYLRTADGLNGWFDELPMGEAFWVEAIFPGERDEAVKTAALSWPGGSLAFPVERVRPRTYVGGPFYVVPPPPGATRTDGSEGGGR